MATDSKVVFPDGSIKLLTDLTPQELRTMGTNWCHRVSMIMQDFWHLHPETQPLIAECILKGNPVGADFYAMDASGRLLWAEERNEDATIVTHTEYRNGLPNDTFEVPMEKFRAFFQEVQALHPTVVNVKYVMNINVMMMILQS